MENAINLLTIPEAAKKYSLSKYFLRQCVKRQQLPVIMAGRKVLINEKVLINFLMGSTTEFNG